MDSRRNNGAHKGIKAKSDYPLRVGLLAFGVPVSKILPQMRGLATKTLTHVNIGGAGLMVPTALCAVIAPG
jgi:hypothetical protein